MEEDAWRFSDHRIAVVTVDSSLTTCCPRGVSAMLLSGEGVAIAIMFFVWTAAMQLAVYVACDAGRPRTAHPLDRLKRWNSNWNGFAMFRLKRTKKNMRHVRNELRAALLRLTTMRPVRELVTY